MLNATFRTGPSNGTSLNLTKQLGGEIFASFTSLPVAAGRGNNTTLIQNDWMLTTRSGEGEDDNFSTDSGSFEHFMWQLNAYLTPVIIAVGLFGNLLSFFVFVCTHVKRLSSSVYLAALAVADTGFLVQLFVVWLGYVRVFLFHQQVWCQAFVYLTYVCSFLSVW